MIDPRALQQHFRRVHENKQPQKNTVPRIPDTKPLTAIQTIIVPAETKNDITPTIDTSDLQKELLEVTQALTTLKQSLTQTPQIEPVTLTVPVSVTTVITEIKEEPKKETVIPVVEKETPYGYSPLKNEDDNNEYNPYGYYSRPLF